MDSLTHSKKECILLFRDITEIAQKLQRSMLRVHTSLKFKQQDGHGDTLPTSYLYLISVLIPGIKFLIGRLQFLSESNFHLL